MPIFLAPWFLLAGLAAAIPVALHLLHRRKPKPVPFSTLRFLREAVARTRRSRHLTNFLTLLMRVLILLLLAAAFARPKVRFATWLSEGSRTVIILLDGSASMQYQDGDETCFERARGWALNLVRSLDKSDRVALLVPGLAEPRLVFPAISDHDAIVRAVESVRPGSGTTSLVEALNDVLARLPEGMESMGLEIHLFSDFQTSNWVATAAETLSPQLSKRGILLFLNHVQPAVVANAGIAKASFHPPAVLGDGEFEAQVQIRTAADFSGSSALRLRIDEKEMAQESLKLLPDQAVEARLTAVAGGDADFVKGHLELDADAYAPDNVYRFCLPRLPGIPVLLVDGSAKATEDSRETFFLQRAIQPRGKARSLFQPKTVDWSTFMAEDPRGYSVIVVCNPPSLGGGAIERLEEFVRNGGTAVLMPGQNNSLETELAQVPAFTGLAVRKEVMSEEKAMGIVPSQTPSELEKKLLGIMPPPAALVIRRRLVFTALPTNSVTTFHYPDGGVFLFETPLGQGAFWVASVGANRDWSEWPLTPFFVILNQELVKSSARRTLTGLTTEVGGTLAMDWPEDALNLDFAFRPPGGGERVVNLTRTETSRPLILGGFDEPGYYELEREGRKRVVAVNIPEREVRLTYTGDQELSLGLRGATVYQASTWAKHQQNLVNLRQGRPLWPLLLCVAFFLAITEELFANLRSRIGGFPEALRRFLRRGGRAV